MVCEKSTRKRGRRERGGTIFCEECPTGEKERKREREKILAGSVVLVPASPIGLSEKAGMRERDWNRKGEREKQTEGIPVAWHTAPKEAWPVVCLQCKTVRNKLSPRS